MRVLLLAILTAAGAELSAQNTPLKWNAGVDLQQSARPLPAWSLGAHLSRILVDGRIVAVRTDGSLFTALSQGVGIACFDTSGRCDTRRVSLYGELSGSIMVGELSKSVSAWPFVHAGAGAYFTRWGEGSFTPATGAPSEPGKGSGPSGLVVTGGLGWRLPGLGPPLVVDFSARQYRGLGPFEEDRLAFGLSLSMAW